MPEVISPDTIEDDVVKRASECIADGKADWRSMMLTGLQTEEESEELDGGGS